ncbi:MAG: hypothetical protein ACREBU_05125 [Nitrososphaera sp.]
MLSTDDRLIVVQYAINKYNSEALLKEKLKDVLSPREIERTVDMLIGTQRVRRLGEDMLQNNTSHTELPEMPDHLRAVVDKI